MVRRSALAFAVVLACVDAGCQTSSSPTPGRNLMSGTIEPQPALTPDHVGKRVRVQLRTGGAAITGTVRAVEPAKDTGIIELNHGRETGRLGLRLSQILWVEELAPSTQNGSNQDARQDRAALRFDRARETDPNVQVVYVDFRHDHRHDTGCLLDMAKPLRENPSSVIFVDPKSKATLTVPTPSDPNASLISWQWHAHVLTGDPAKPDDRLERMDVDGKVVLDFKGVALPATLVFVGTPARVQHKESGLDALAPPRVFVVRALPADSCQAVLQRNAELVTRLDSGQGTLWVAAQPSSENEMVLSVYDPDGAHSAVMPQTRFTVQDAILVPAFVLDVTSADGSSVSQRVGGYPIPPFLSQDTPDTAKIHLEVAKKKIDAGFAAPVQVSVRVPDRAAVKADVDVRFYGANPKLKYRLVLAHGRPDSSGKPVKFEPVVTDVNADTSLHSTKLDFAAVQRDKFPSHVFVWHYVAAEWRTTGGFLPPAPPLAGGALVTPPKRRMMVHPAPFPHLKFIKFEGLVPDVNGDSVLTGSGFTPAGGTLGWGGPFVPFGFQVGTTLVNDDSSAGRSSDGTMPPSLAGAGAWAFGGAGFGFGGNAKANASASAGSSSVAIAICGGGCGGGEGGDDRGSDPPGYTGRPGPGATSGYGDPGSGYNRPIFSPNTSSGY